MDAQATRSRDARPSSPWILPAVLLGCVSIIVCCGMIPAPQTGERATASGEDARLDPLAALRPVDRALAAREPDVISRLIIPLGANLTSPQTDFDYAVQARMRYAVLLDDLRGAREAANAGDWEGSLARAEAAYTQLGIVTWAPDRELVRVQVDEALARAKSRGKQER